MCMQVVVHVDVQHIEHCSWMGVALRWQCLVLRGLQFMRFEAASSNVHRPRCHSWWQLLERPLPVGASCQFVLSQAA